MLHYHVAIFLFFFLSSTHVELPRTGKTMLEQPNNHALRPSLLSRTCIIINQLKLNEFWLKATQMPCYYQQLQDVIEGMTT